MNLKVAVVDDNSKNRTIVRDKLLRAGNFEIVLQAIDGNDFLMQMKSLVLDKIPDIVMMDLEMPGMNGIAAIAAASTFYPDVKFVVLTIFDDEENIFKAIKAGACGYILKEDSASNLSEQLLQLFESGVGPISPGIAHKILQMMQNEMQEGKSISEKVDAVSDFQLTQREKEILQLLLDGLLYKEIGDKLDISPNTAKKHVLNIYQKLHVSSRAQAMKLAVAKGLI